MRSLLLQVVAVVTINIKRIAQRLWLSMTTVLAIALVVWSCSPFSQWRTDFSARSHRPEGTA